MKKYGLLGYPLTHSFSKRFFTEKFEKENIEASYENFEIERIEKFPELLKANPDVVGFNVTIPYKEQVIPYLDELDEASNKIQAVNTIKVSRTGKQLHLKGYNTDTYGFESSLKPLLKQHHKKALILGIGGASKAIKYVLEKLGIEHLSVSRRELKTGEISWEDVNAEVVKEHQLIINTTPLGTYPKEDTFPNIPYEYIGDEHLLFDLVYNPEVTQFLAKGKARGAVIKNGYDMLIGQATKSYEIWNNG